MNIQRPIDLEDLRRVDLSAITDKAFISRAQHAVVQQRLIIEAEAEQLIRTGAGRAELNLDREARITELQRQGRELRALAAALEARQSELPRARHTGKVNLQAYIIEALKAMVTEEQFLAAVQFGRDAVKREKQKCSGQ